MAPNWLVTFLANLGAALVKWAVTEIASEVQKSREAAELERQNGIRNGKNAQRYSDAKSRADQINAAVNLINRNDVV